MTTNRRTIRHASKSRITPEVVELWKRLQATPPGQRRIELNREFCQALKLKPWAFSPDEVALNEPKPGYLIGSGLCSAPTWEVAVALRRELIAAVEAEAS